MSYVEKHLMVGEGVVYRTRLNTIVFVGPVIALFVAFMSLSNEESRPFGVLFLLAGLIAGSAAFINFKTSEFAVTTKRVILKTGFIRRCSQEILLSKIEGVQVNQGIIGRILGYGSVIIGGTGGARDPYHRINDPLGLRRAVQEQIEIEENGGVPGKPGKVRWASSERGGNHHDL